MKLVSDFQHLFLLFLPCHSRSLIVWGRIWLYLFFIFLNIFYLFFIWLQSSYDGCHLVNLFINVAQIVIKWETITHIFQHSLSTIPICLIIKLFPQIAGGDVHFMLPNELSHRGFQWYAFGTCVISHTGSFKGTWM